MPASTVSRALVSALFLSLGCSSDTSSTPAGSEAGACYPNGTCDAGLVCASDLCVVIPEGTSGGGPGENTSGGPGADSGDQKPGGEEGGEEGGDEAGGTAPAEGTGSEDTGDGSEETGMSGNESESRGDCPFSIDQISCASFCDADLYYSEVCNNGGATTSYDECFEACEYTISNDLLDESPFGIEWYGCMQQTGGACDEFLDCFSSTSC